MAGAINKQAQLASAYQDLGKELGSENLKVVGGYTIGRVIGEGSFGAVHLATHRLTGSRCAIKKIPKTMSSQITREIHHHRRLHHLHIVQLYEIIATEQHIWLVTELCSGGELFDYLVERGRMVEGEARRLFGELTVAVGYMHNEGIVHRDLKLENVLLDGELKVKLADLGFAREWSRGKLMETHCGTTGYASPEMLSGKKYLGVETDVWSLGIILYTLLCGGLPFDDDDERVMKEMIIKGEYEEPDWLSTDARSLIKILLNLNPAERPSVEAIFTHPWFRADMPVEHSPKRHSGDFSHTEQALELLHLDSYLPVAQNSRTPSRTKRRSVSSTLSLERRQSHHSVHQQQADYLGMLRSQRPPAFSTPSEKFLLNQLNDLGIDIGQLTHSVENDACDSSSASWWLLRARQAERGETDDFVVARQSSNARKREKLAAYAREDRKIARDTEPTVAFDVIPTINPPTTPTGDSIRKPRSPSLSMLQRATSALLGKEEEPTSRSVSPTKLIKPRDPSLLSVAGTSPKSMWSSWTTFRQFFDQGERRKKPAVVLSRGIAARTPHVNRINHSVSRRASLDKRPMYSRRSSSVNSRRSSITSLLPPSSDNLPQLGRRASQRSHGSATPTSDREHAVSREMRSPSMQSDSGRLPQSPLHNYQRRPPQGTASKRIRHIRVIPETLRSSASSIKSNHSSRASSVDGINSDSESRHRRDSDSLARQIHRRGSPLAMGKRKPKPVLRDVFQGKDDEWEDEDEYVGGYGQSGNRTRWVDGFRTASSAVKVQEESRRGIPASRGAPMPIAEEEEGEDL